MAKYKKSSGRDRPAELGGETIETENDVQSQVQDLNVKNKQEDFYS
jgi:hypothetical protein